MKKLVKKSAVTVFGAVVLVTALESFSFFQLDNSSSLFFENVDSEAYWPLSPEDEWLPGEKYTCDRADNFGSDHCTISDCVRKL